MIMTNKPIEVICREDYYAGNTKFFKFCEKHLPKLLPILFRQKLLFKKGQKVKIAQNCLDKNSYFLKLWEFEGNSVRKYFFINKKDIRKEKLNQINAYK